MARSRSKSRSKTPMKKRASSKKRSRSASPCKQGKLTVRRRSYTRADGTRVKATTYQICDQGNKGKTSRGAKGGKYSKEKPWISREGKLGGPGYLSKTPFQRHVILDKCVNAYGYRSCLGSILVLNRNSEVKAKYGKIIEADKDWLVKKYGAGL